MSVIVVSIAEAIAVAFDYSGNVVNSGLVKNEENSSRAYNSTVTTSVQLCS